MDAENIMFEVRGKRASMLAMDAESRWWSSCDAGKILQVNNGSLD